MTTPIYRLDQFVVPLPARAEFMARVRETHAILHAQPGFVRDDLLEQPHGSDKVRIVTVVQWRGEAAVRAAREKVRQGQAAQGFDPQELMARLGITADMGVYYPVEME